MQLPEAFLNNMRTYFKSDFDDFLHSFLIKQYPSIRLHSQKGKLLQQEGNKIAWEPFGYQLTDSKQFITDPFWHAGAFYVQESSSMFLGHVFRQIFKNEFPQLVLDLCAAPGGKSTHLLDLMQQNGVLISNEILPKRNIILKENLSRWGYSNVIITQNDPADFHSLYEKFDLIVVDAPCSGEGLFRKEPSATLEWSQQNVKICSLRQQNILRHIATSLKTGGYLIYSTCTFEPSENEQQIEELLNTGCFEVVRINIDDFPEIVENKLIPSYHFYPHKTSGSGFYMAVLQKTNKIQPTFMQKKNFNNIKGIQPLIFPWHKSESQINLTIKNNIFKVNNPVAEIIKSIKNNLNITYAGLQIADFEHGQYSPATALALSIDTKENPTIALNHQEALAYLQGLSISKEISEKGWQIVAYNGLPLGWVKAVPGRLNNGYPKPWRIKKKL